MLLAEMTSILGRTVGRILRLQTMLLDKGTGIILECTARILLLKLQSIVLLSQLVRLQQGYRQVGIVVKVHQQYLIPLQVQEVRLSNFDLVEFDRAIWD